MGGRREEEDTPWPDCGWLLGGGQIPAAALSATLLTPHTRPRPGSTTRRRPRWHMTENSY